MVPAATEVPADWSLKPTAVAAGDKFRLLFLSSTKRNATSTDIADYNTFIQGRAAAGHADIQTYSTGFRAVGCTAAVDARDNTYTTYTATDKGVPVYWLNGAKAADEYEDFYDGSWDDEANDKNESGTDAHDTSVIINYPFTGCNHDGTESFTGSTSRALGASRVRPGGLNSSVSDVGPLHHATSAVESTTGITRPMYGLSAVFQVAAAVVVPNNPPTVANAIPDQSATAGTAFSYVFPDTTFSDADTSDTLTYTATKADDTALPTWLAFAAGTRTFSGTPTAAETVSVKVTASDGNGGSVSDTFDITVAADTTPPTLTSAGVNEAGLFILLGFSENLQLSNLPPASAFTVTAGGSAVTVSGVLPRPGAPDVFVITVSPAIRQGQAIVVTYTDPTAGDDATAFQDTAGNDAATFTTGLNGVPAVTNSSTVTNTPATGAPTITGTAQVGQTLTAGTTAIMDAEGLTSVSYTYQWIRVATDNTETNISGATASTYTLVAADLGTTVKVTVSFTDDASNAETLTSAATATVSAAANTLATGAPTITGTAQVGQTLTAGTTAIMDADGLTSVSYTYQWIRVDGGTETNISGATASTHTLVAADQGTTIKVRVSFTDDASNAETLTSAATAVVAAAPNTLPSASDGTVTTNEDTARTFAAADFNFLDTDPGDTLESVEIITLPASGTGTLALSGTPVTANQVVAATNIGVLAYTPPANANGTGYASFTFKVSDGTAESAAAYTMTITVTAVNDAPTVATAIPDQPATVGTVFSYAFPANTFSDADTGDMLSYTATKADGATLPTWLTFAAGTRTFSGTPQPADVGTVSVKVTASDGNGGSGSDDFDIMVSAASNTAATGALTITGTAQVGQTLTAVTTGIMDDDGLTNVSYAYQWIRVDGTDADISGATSITYTLVGADLGTTIKVKVSFTDDLNNPETLTSAATAAVSAAPNTLPSASDGTVTTNEDSAHTFAAAEFNFSDADPGDTLESVEIITLPASGTGTLALSGTPVTAGQEIAEADIGTLTYTPPANANGTGYASFTFKVSDGTAESAAAYTMTITVTAVNDAPTVANTIPDRSATVGTAFSYAFPANTFSDADTGDTLTYAATKADGATLPAWLTFAAGTRTFSGTPQTADVGTVSVKVTASDGNGGSGSDDFDITVSAAANNLATGAPTITGMAQVGQTLTAGTTAIMDADGLTSVSYTYQWIRVATDNTETNISGATASTYTLVAADQGKTIKVKVSFTDDASNAETLTSAATAAVAAAVPNNPPAFSADTAARSVAENTAAGQNVGAALTATDADSDTLTYTLEGADAASFDIVSGSGQIRTKAGVTYNHEAKSTYTVIVKADDGKAGTATVTVTITVTDVDEPPGRPAAPSVSATAGLTTSLDVTWTAPTNTGPDIDNYDLIYRESGSGPFTSGPQNVTGASAAIGSLAPGTAYQVQVRATNAEGDSDWSFSGTGQTTGASVPGAPTGLSATASGNTQINLSWTAPASTGGAAITGYRIEVSSNGGSSWTNLVANTSNTTTTYAHTGLTAGATRHYRVSAINTNDSGTASNVDSATTGTTVPGAPTRLSATASGSTRINLSWSVPASTGGAPITGYRIEVSPNGASNWTDRVANTPTTATTYAHTGLAAGATRYYRVSAINANGAGTASNTASATTTAAGETTVTFTASSYTASEGQGEKAITVELSAPPSARVTIPLVVTHLGGATAADYSGPPSSLTFAAGRTRFTFGVKATDDSHADAGESVRIGFGTLPGGYAPGERPTATVTLEDNDDANLIVNFGTERHTTVQVRESDTVWHRFTFSLSTRSWGPPNGNPQQPVTIPLVVTHRGGADSDDYTPIPSSVTFGVGESVTSFSMRAIPDGKRETGEGLRLDFGPLPAGVRKGTWGPYETIAFVDQVLPGYTVLFGAEAYTATEGGAPARVSIHLSEPVEIEPLVVRLVVTHVGATAADYTGIPKSVRFGVGEQTQTITVKATDDTDDDDGESVTLSFVNDPNGRVRVRTGPASATVALADNDGPRRVTVSFGAVTYTATEGGADATVRVELDAAPGRSVTVPLTKAHRGNATAADYSGIPMNVTFAANQTSRTFPVMATAGDGSDGGESVSIGFGTLPEGVFAGSPAATTVTLADGGEQRLVVNFGSSRGHTVQVREGARRLRLNVLLDSSPRRPLTIPLVVTHVGGATEADYAAIPESVTFAAGQTSAHYYVRALPDEEDETGEGLQLDFGPLPPGVRKGTWGPYETIDFLDPATAANLSVSGTVVTVGFPGALDGGSTPSPRDFVVSVEAPGGEKAMAPVAAVAVEGSDVFLQLARPVAPDDTVTLSYLADAMHPIRDEAGSPAAPLTDAPVRNQTPASGLGPEAGLRVQAANPAPLAALLEAAQVGAGTGRLDLSSRHLTDITALAGLTELRELDLRDNAIEDLWPLAGLRGLEALYLSGNQISDLRPLAGLRGLKVLDLAGNRISDLWPLSGLTELRELDLADNAVADLGPLTGLAGLEALDLAGNRISDLWGPGYLTRLERLNLADNAIEDLRPLARLTRLEVLLLDRNRITDVLALSPMSELANLGLAGNPVTDLWPLAGLGQLHRLDLSGNAAADPSALGRLENLRWLWLDPAPAAELEAAPGRSEGRGAAPQWTEPTH